MNHGVTSDWRGPVGRRRLAILGGSLALHAVILAAIGLGLVQTRSLLPDTTPIFVELEPRPLLPGEIARRSAQNSTPSTQSQAATSSSRPDNPLIREADEDRPSPPNPRIANTAPSGLSTPQASGAAGAVTEDRWTVRGPELRGAVARSLRLSAAGCRTMDGHLSESEQRVCDDNFNTAAGRAAPIGPRTLNASETRRQEQFASEGAAALARYERRRAPMRSGVGVVGITPECPGGNLRGTCPGANLRSNFQHQEEAPFGGTAGPK